MSSQKKQQSILLQYTAAITGSLTSIGYGLNLSWTSPVIPYLTSSKSHLPVSKYEGDFLSSLFPVGLIFGYLINPWIIDRISRKKTLLLYAIPQISSCSLIIFATNINYLIVGRILAGFGYGGGASALTVYLSEIGGVKNRGVFLVMLPVSLNIGILWVSLLGAFSSYNVLNVVMLLLPLIFCITFLFMPDSTYFRQRNEEDKMIHLLNYQQVENLDLKNVDLEKTDLKNTDTTNSEKNNEKFKSKKSFEEEEKSKSGFFETLKVKEMRIYKLLTISTHRRALLILITLSAIIPLSGSASIVFFAQQLLSYSGSSTRAQDCSVILTGITLVACLVSIPLVERIRRKVILLYSGIFSTIGLALVGVFFFLENQDVNISSVRWLPLFGLTMYQFALTFGLLNLFYVYLGELFPVAVKSHGVMICKLSITIFLFLALFRFQKLVDFLGLPALFFMYAIIMATGTYIVYVITPETKGKSIEEIQLLLKSRKSFFS